MFFLIRYKLVYDLVNWVIVDERLGVVIIRKEIDREFFYVNNSFYIIIVYVVDDGKYLFKVGGKMCFIVF